MKILTSFLFLIACWLGPSPIFGQSNLITNSQFEDAVCGDGSATCPHFGTCVTDWTITHGTPNYVEEACLPPPFSVDNHYISLVCRNPKSEGIYTRVDLEPGCHRLFMRVRVVELPPGLSVNLRVSLDKDLEPWPELVCQQIIPSTPNTTLIHNAPLNENGGAWHWIMVDFGITHETSFLDQLMITGLSSPTESEQATIQIDCVSLFKNCEESLFFSSFPNVVTNLPDEIYNSCSTIIINTFGSGSVDVPEGGAVEMYAGEYIRILPNFRADGYYRAALADACAQEDAPLARTPPCFGCDRISGGGSLGDGREGDGRSAVVESTGAIESPSLFPNPSRGLFELSLPEGLHQVRIFDLLGKRVYHAQHHSATSIDASTWSKGVYLVEIRKINGSEVNTLKLMIQ